MLRTKPVITLCKQPKLLDKNRRLELSAKNLQYSTETEFSLKFSFARLPASQAKWIFYSITVTRRREHTRWVFMVCVCMCVCVHILILIRIYCATQQKATMRKTCRPPRADWSLSASPGRQLSSCPTVVCRLSVCLLVYPCQPGYSTFSIASVSRILSRVYQLVFSGHFIQTLRSLRDFSSKSKVFSRRPHPHRQPLAPSPIYPRVRQAN